MGVEYLCGSVLRQKASTRTCFPFSGFQVQFACPPVFQNLGRGFNSNLIQARSEKISKMVLISCHLSILLACLSVSLSVWRLVDSLLVTVIVGLPPINLWSFYIVPAGDSVSWRSGAFLQSLNLMTKPWLALKGNWCIFTFLQWKRADNLCTS